MPIAAQSLASNPIVDALSIDVLTVPTDTEESDGTLDWNQTTMVLVRADGGGARGLGYTYGSPACARVVSDTLQSVVRGQPIMDVGRSFRAMLEIVRNHGRKGIAAHAISAVDVALWDLKARVLGCSLADLLGRVQEAVPLYGSGGFTSHDDRQLANQLAGWVEDGFSAVKMKVGREPRADVDRVRAARAAIGQAVDLMVDANGAYARKQASAMAHRFAELGVSWFEEPVSSDDVDGLALLCRTCPPGVRVAAGEYLYDLFDAQRLLRAGAVDVLQADITRCLGLSGFLRVAALCEAWSVPLSCHTAPSLHVFAAAASPAVMHLEWFHDHVRLERMLFEGALRPHRGTLSPDRSRPGLGLEPRPRALERYAS